MTVRVLSRLENISILLIEDNLFDVELLQLALIDPRSKIDYTIEHCETMAEAAEILAHKHFSIVFTDLDLPDADNMIVVEKIISFTETPIIVLTGSDDGLQAAAAMKLGAQDFINKNELKNFDVWRSINYAIEREHAHQEYRKVLDQNADGIVVVNIEKEILFINKSASSLLGKDQVELIGQVFEYPLSEEMTEVKMGANTIVELRQVRTEWRGIDTKIISLHDVSQHRALQKELAYHANHDPLTGLANRALLTERLQHASENLTRSHCQFAVLMMDLDRFKLINDTLGHDIGDELLKETALRLKSVTRETDTLARTGGDEFVIIAENINRESSIETLAKKLLACMEKVFLVRDNHFTITTSIGIAIAPKDGDAPLSLLRNADIAMYRSKEEGRNRFHFFDKIFHQETIRRLEMESELKQALESEQFKLFYQPKFDQNGLCGAEALLRWQHPSRGLLLPNSFIYLLENTRLIIKAEKWVLENVCRQLSKWQNLIGEFRVAINVSAPTLLDTHLVKTIAHLLKVYELKPAQIEIEVTESILLENIEQTSKTLNELKAMGIAITLDDFGTGYSSLNYLMQFPAFSTLKIDHTLTQKAEHDLRAGAILTTIVELAHSLDMSVVAEGVETNDQFYQLHKKGCDYFQGYMFSRPIPPCNWDENIPLWKENFPMRIENK